MSTRRACVVCGKPAEHGKGANWVSVPIDGVLRQRLAHDACVEAAKKRTTSQRP